MTQTILDLWNGNLAPCEHCGSHDAQLNHLLGLMERERKDLYGELTPAQAERLQRYIDFSETYLLRMLELAFSDGYCLGCRLTVEALSD